MHHRCQGESNAIFIRMKPIISSFIPPFITPLVHKQLFHKSVNTFKSLLYLQCGIKVVYRNKESGNQTKCHGLSTEKKKHVKPDFKRRTNNFFESIPGRNILRRNTIITQSSPLILSFSFYADISSRFVTIFFGGKKFSRARRRTVVTGDLVRQLEKAVRK